jgi:squalene-hopene/tetraprenyl-beta-curcumene cyclase
MSPGFEITDALLARCAAAMHRSADAVLRMQDRDGSWQVALTSDTTLESDWILLQIWLQPPVDGVWKPANAGQVQRAAASIYERANPDGGFPIYPGGPSDLNASVKAYFALKLVGYNPTHLAMLRECIRNLGGLQAADAYTKINLSFFGLYPREHTPTIPPELILAGGFFSRMSSRSRAIAIPLAIAQSANVTRPVPNGFSIAELALPGVPMSQPDGAGMFSWRGFFQRLDGFLKFWETSGLKSLRKKALRRCEAWLLDRSKSSGGSFFSSRMYTIMAMDVLGYPPDDPRRVEAQAHLDRLTAGRGEAGFHVQPFDSAVPDTALAAFALGEAGVSGLQSDKSVDWLLRHAGGSSPDIDATAMALLALDPARGAGAAAWQVSRDRSLAWLRSMQSKDGGWAAFDKDNERNALTHAPFADPNAMFDPTSPDITGRVLEALMRHGAKPEDPAVRRAVEYLVRSQESDGSWYGRWGVAYIYGACFALRGLQAAGESDREAHVLRGGEWLRSIQNADGGWGESCESYRKGSFVAAPSTPSQTAWAVLGLIAGGDTTSSSIQMGVEYLCRTQKPDGTYDGHAATGTGMPRASYFNHRLHRAGFPLLALAGYYKVQQNGEY